MKRPGGLAALILGGFVILTAALPSGTAAAADRQAVDPRAPEAPLPGYTPRFVTQTDEASPWEDCLWASGAMLIDKWTRGEQRVDRRRLRRASGDTKAGSTFTDLARGVSRLYGWRPRWSPSGGDPMTWDELLQRLAEGGGAVVAGDYGDLGNPYIRWDRSYAANPRAAGHAMYVERYDAERDRLWLMDPLGRGGYSGEWIAASRLRRFVWRSGRFVHAMATPPPPAVSTAGYLPGRLSIDSGPHRAGDAMTVSLTFTEEGRWPLPDLRLATSWELVEPDGWAPPVADTGSNPPAEVRIDRTAAPLLIPPPSADDPGLEEPLAAPTAPALASTLTLPDRPGIWRLSAAIERRDGRPVPKAWQQPPLEVRVWGDRGAVVVPVIPNTTVVAASTLSMAVTVENVGRLAWPYDGLDPRLAEEQPSTAIELHVSWLRADGREMPVGDALALTAASGEQLSIAFAVAVPRVSGSYVLRVDVRDAQGSLLAPEVTGASVPVEVGRMPTPEQAPVTNR